MMVSKRLVMVLLAAMCCVSAGFCADGEKPVDPYTNSSVLVEAFVVRVSTEELAEMGVSPIGQAPDGVTKIIEALAEPDGAEMVAAAKVLVGQDGESSVRSHSTVYATRKQGNTVSYDPYENRVYFKAHADILAEKIVRLGYSFSASLFEENEGEAGFPITYEYDWNSIFTVQSGKPIVAGAAPSEGSVTFLILCVTIQDAESK